MNVSFVTYETWPFLNQLHFQACLHLSGSLFCMLLQLINTKSHLEQNNAWALQGSSYYGPVILLRKSEECPLINPTMLVPLYLKLCQPCIYLSLMIKIAKAFSANKKCNMLCPHCMYFLFLFYFICPTLLFQGS